MDRGSGLVSPEISTQRRAGSRLKLLVELEPAHRVFFRNLGDTLLFRSSPPQGITWLPAPFWDDVFIRSSLPWWGLLESLLWHSLVVAALWSVSQYWSLQKLPYQRRPHAPVTYYPPSETFPTIASSPPRPRPASAQKQAAGGGRTGSRAGGPRALRVARERARGREGGMAPPDIKMGGGGGSPSLGASGAPAPAVPLGATGHPRLTVPGDLAQAVGPPATIGEALARRSGLPDAGVIAPAPELGSLSSHHGVPAAAAGVVGPPPTVTGPLQNGADLNIAPSEVVAPAPRLPMREQRDLSGIGGGMGGTGTAVVPPPPTVQRAGALSSGRGGAASGTGTGTQIVPPPASAQDLGGPAGGRGNGTVAGAQIVPPPPALRGAGGPGGRGGRGGSISGMGVQVVPPPPGVEQVGNSYGRRTGNGTSGGNGQVVGPPPTVAGLGNGFGGGRGGALGGTGVAVGLAAGKGGGGAGGTNGHGTGISGSGTGSGTSGSGSGSRPGNGTGSGAGTGIGAGNGPGVGPGSAGGSGGGSGPGGGKGNGGMGTGAGSGNGQGETGSELAGAGSGSGNGNGNGEGTSSNGSGNGAGNGNGSGEAASGSGNGAGSPAEIAGNSKVGGLPDAVIKTPGVGEKPRGPAPVELPVRLIGLALKLPSTSYFSNYEVFFAERRLAKGQTQLIKLVYVFLPYQRRLTEFGLSDSRVFKLRVTRDPSCDESLLQMTWPEAEQSQTDDASNPGSNNKLPCYRTTADDYKRAIEQR